MIEDFCHYFTKVTNQFFILRDRLTEDDTICSAWIKVPSVSVLGENGWSILWAIYWSYPAIPLVEMLWMGALTFSLKLS